MFNRIKFCSKYILLLLLLITTEGYSVLSVKNLPPRNDYFTGRTAYLNNMQQKLLLHNVVYLVGYGGIGKSQMAKEYSYINENEYDLIWWFDLNSDLVVQYENLLIFISNNKKFNNLLNVNINSIAPGALVDFTNTLLSACEIKWLLIFDNALSNSDIKLPRPKKSMLQHIIITTRKNQHLGDNIFTLESFTNQEAETFLSKIHPKEKKEAVAKLYKTLHNYPLALAQVSEEILMYKDGIESFFKRHNKFDREALHMRSDITQEYNNNYHEVLSMILQDIEQKDEGAAKILYMLALLPTNLTNNFLKDLLGSKVEEKLIALSNYGIIQIASNNGFQTLNIHDVIRDEVLKKLDSKEKIYKKGIICTLINKCKKFYAKKNLQCLNGLATSDDNVATLYAFINVALQNDLLDDEVVDAIIIALRLNNILFNKNADLDLYQQLVDKIYNANLNHISPNKKALLYTVSFPVFESEDRSKERLIKHEKEMLHLLQIVETKKDRRDLFFIYTRLLQFYLILGDFAEAKKYSVQAKEHIHYACDTFILLRYWYASTWLYYELREIDKGIIALDHCVKLDNDKLLSPVGKLFVKDFRAKFNILLGKKKEAAREIKNAIQNATIYYNNAPSNVIGELEYTKTLLYLCEGKYELLEKQCHHALSILTKVFGGDIKDLTQAHIHVILGGVYAKKGNHNLALKEYGRSLSFYSKKSCGKGNHFYEYGELLSGLCSLYYKQKNYLESQVYFQKLVTDFGLESDLVEKLIKKLPREYLYQIGGGGAK